MDASEDLACIEKVKGGNTASYAFLVDKYQHMAYTIALKILRNEEDAQDATQEGFLKAYQQIHQFAGRSKFSTWLYTIVYRTAISRLKENKVEMFSINSRLVTNYAEDNSTPQHEQLTVQDQQWYIKQAIEKLPQQEALLITLFYMGEHSVNEIRDITGMSVTNIKIKLFRARRKLEHMLRFLLDNEKNDDVKA